MTLLYTSGESVDMYRTHGDLFSRRCLHVQLNVFRRRKELKFLSAVADKKRSYR